MLFCAARKMYECFNSESWSRYACHKNIVPRSDQAAPKKQVSIRNNKKPARLFAAGDRFAPGPALFRSRRQLPRNALPDGPFARAPADMP
jgi:hypothetical protein